MRWRIIWEAGWTNPDLPTVVDVPSTTQDIDLYLHEKYGYFVADRDLVSDESLSEGMCLESFETHLDDDPCVCTDDFWFFDQDVYLTETYWNNIHKSY